MCNKTKSDKTNKTNKKHFCSEKCCLQFFSSDRFLVEQRENCLKINNKQTVKLGSSSIEFKNYFKKSTVPFKFYADFESLLERVRGSDKK